ncbi:unnamed protein product [Rhizophagus irregularis]|nr:unnamed protein product [Rhizophagus irregularis]
MAKKRVEIRWFSGSLIGIPADLSGRTQSFGIFGRLPPTGLRTRGKLDFGAFDAFEFEILYLKFGTPIGFRSLEGEKG